MPHRVTFIPGDGTGPELYDLAADRNETKDLASEKPDVVRRLRDAALKWRKSVP